MHSDRAEGRWEATFVMTQCSKTNEDRESSQQSILSASCDADLVLKSFVAVIDLDQFVEEWRRLRSTFNYAQ
uniref:Uncharacterized protein n=1 Tax=Physcomitrium patens TaxID=3218 RepID=A0A2K1K6E5_PHYPA|nr:hypothetical protein PHYPA_011244 [Physcomitrium patens]